ncbi:MAG: outer membrane protein transport protein [Longimicrobiales bacterium]
MTTRAAAPLLLAFISLLFLAAPAHATDGHFLHGVGAVNSAMGGAGVAAPGDLLGSFYLNPAGLRCEHGTRISLGFEMMKPQRTVSSSFGGISGRTESKTDFTPIPAFGWATRVNDRVSVGVGMLGIGGFGVDYPVDPTNPVLGPRPRGFGQVASNFQFMKISPALAWTVSDRLVVGVALNLDWASLSVDPMPTAAPHVDPGTGSAFYSRATATDGAFGAGLQAGLIYEAWPSVRVGLAYTSPQWFQDFEYNAVWENPRQPDFGTSRTLTFAMDAPAVYSGGLAVGGGAVLWTGDARLITYSSTDGFAEAGMDATGAVRGFGWEDIWVLATGLQVRPVRRLALRAGYNFTENPVPAAQSAFNVPAPAIVQHHLTLGTGLQLDGLRVDIGYYHAFSNQITGDFHTPAGTMSVTNEMLEDSFLLSFSFTPSS